VRDVPAVGKKRDQQLPALDSLTAFASLVQAMAWTDNVDARWWHPVGVGMQRRPSPASASRIGVRFALACDLP